MLQLKNVQTLKCLNSKLGKFFKFSNYKIQKSNSKIVKLYNFKTTKKNKI